MIPPSIYSYIKEQESKFETEEIQVGDNWYWNLRRHVQMLFHLKNGLFFTGNNDLLRAFKNVMEPILELCYWTEDLEMKDVVLFIEGENSRVQSFLVKKWHDEKFVREHDLDTFFDEVIESDLDYGGVLVQKTAETRPEVIPLKSIAFCDQSDILGGPIGFKHPFSIEKLRAMSELGWGDEKNGADISIEDLIKLATEESTPAGQVGENKGTGKTIDVYIVKGSLPEHYLKDNDNMDYWCPQVQIRAFYTKKDGQYNGKEGVCLYKKKESDSNLKFFTSKKVENRGLGRGVAEMVLHPQIWTNFLTIHKTRMLESASKILPWTDDDQFTQVNNLNDADNLQVMKVGEGKSFGLVPTSSPVNTQLLDKAVDEWFNQAQLAGAAFDPILGMEAVSGTTFKGQERTVQQGKGPHNRRRGKRAKFFEELYRDWFIPDMKKELKKGSKFLATLSTDELQWVVDQLVENKASEKIKAMIMEGKVPNDEEMQLFKDVTRATLSKQGTKYLIEILEGEMEGIEDRLGISIAGKQKDLAGLNDKVLSIFQFAFQNPIGFQQTMQIPGMAKAFQDILEFSGINQTDFAALATMPAPKLPEEQQPAPAQKPAPKPVAA